MSSKCASAMLVQIRRNGIRCSNVGNRLRQTLGKKGDFTNHQSLPCFQQPTFSNNIPIRRRLSQKVDIQAGGHCEGDFSCLAKDGHIGRAICDAHQRGTGDRSTRTQMLMADFLPQYRSSCSDTFHSTGILRKYPGQECTGLVNIHGQCSSIRGIICSAPPGSLHHGEALSYR